MRILGFSEMWPKLQQDTFTTFRFPRNDKDWYVGEVVRVVCQPRRKGGGDYLGIAEITLKELREIYGSRNGHLTNEEAVGDGFKSKGEMQDWLAKQYPFWRIWNEPMSKLTLQWREKESNGTIG